VVDLLAMTPDSVADRTRASTPGKRASARLPVVIALSMCDYRELLQAPVFPPRDNR
jgi:hypothetical protein